jgi:hypothetical protein
VEREIGNGSCLEELIFIPSRKFIGLELVGFKELLLFRLYSFPKILFLKLLSMRLHILVSSIC